MHVKAKELAVSGLMLALTVICILLGSVIETNTLFLLAAASYCEGIIIREYGLRSGIAFFTAGILLGMLVAPNKFYVISYGAMALYILLTEVLWDMVGKLTPGSGQRSMYVAVKYLIFNIIYLSMIYFMRDLIFPQKLSALMWLGVILAGQIGVWFYDKAYHYFQGELWGKLRKSLRLSE